MDSPNADKAKRKTHHGRIHSMLWKLPRLFVKRHLKTTYANTRLTPELPSMDLPETKAQLEEIHGSIWNMLWTNHNPVHNSLVTVTALASAMWFELRLNDESFEKLQFTKLSVFMRKEYRKVGLEAVFDAMEAKATEVAHASEEFLKAYVQAMEVAIQDSELGELVLPWWGY